MNKFCKCGGKLCTLNANSFYFRKKCPDCKTIYKQHKRQAAKKVQHV